MEPRNANELFAEVVNDRCQSLLAYAESLLLQEYPTDTSRSLCNALIESSQQLRVRTGQIISSYPGASESFRQELDLEISSISNFIDFAFGVLCPLIASSSISSLPSEVISPISRMVKRFFPDSEIIVTGVPELNYYFRQIGQTISNVFRNVNLSEVLSANGVPDNLMQFILCTNPPNGVLTHCLLAHEIGHALYVQHGADKELLPKLHYDEKELSEYISQTISEISNRFNTHDSPAAIQGSFEQSRGYLEYAYVIG